MKAFTNIDIDHFFSQLHNAEESLLFLDYDGTLAPFCEDPKEARPYPGVMPRLMELHNEGRTRLIFITGRQIKDLLPFLPFKEMPEIWGVHGAERLLPRSKEIAYALLTPSQAQGLQEGLQALEISPWDLRIEEKKWSIAAHWRGQPHPLQKDIPQWLQEMWSPIAEHHSLELFPFEMGLELRAIGISKKRAVTTVLEEYAHLPLLPIAYLGDDYTDEEAFSALGERALKIVVRKKSRETLADLQLVPPEELLSFFKRWEDALGIPHGIPHE